MRVKSQESRVEIADCGTQRVPGIADSISDPIRNPKSEIRNQAPSPRRGLTLIELLVVVIILTTIVAAAIPILAPSNDDRRLREATRTLNTYITGAQARAISMGRPYGVALKRLSADTGRTEDNGVCLEVFYVEQQPPFSGFDRSSKACVSLLQQIGLAVVKFVREAPGQPKSFGLPIGILPDLFPDDMLRPGDVIEINGTTYELVYGTGQQYELANVTVTKNGFYASRGGTQNRSAVTILARPINDSGQQINIEYDNAGFPLGADRPSNAPTRPTSPFWTAPAPYRILRQPTYASDEPYQLPEGTAIDLRASGVGSDDYFYVPNMNDNNQPVIFMFAPEGRISRVTYSELPISNPNEREKFDKPVADNVYLLVGKRENIPVEPAATDTTLDSAGPLSDEEKEEIRSQINWLNGSSRWVVLGSQSGRIVTIENAFVDPAVVFTTSSPPILASSEELRNEQIAAAREFTREMAQLGGR